MGFKKIVIIMSVLSGIWLMAFSKVFKEDKMAIKKDERTSQEGNGIKFDRTTDSNSEKAIKYDPIVVLELFTSQGCSSGPPADTLLDKVKKEYGNTVFALSYHVDYWNYIGWEDPFSSSRFTEKQRKYNAKLKSRSNYTPELVVNGKEHLVGSNASKVYGAIQKYAVVEAVNGIILSELNSDPKAVFFDYKVLGDVRNKNLRAVLVIDERTTDVKRGENKNRKLTNSNIVVAEKLIPLDGGSKEESGSTGKSFITIPEIVQPEEKLSLLLLAENENYDINGAAKAHIER